MIAVFSSYWQLVIFSLVTRLSIYLPVNQVLRVCMYAHECLPVCTCLHCGGQDVNMPPCSDCHNRYTCLKLLYHIVHLIIAVQLRLS